MTAKRSELLSHHQPTFAQALLVGGGSGNGLDEKGLVALRSALYCNRRIVRLSFPADDLQRLARYR
jgi:hypothetical protein